MKLYSENEHYKLYEGNMLDMLEVIEPNSIDSIITDPPYELNFMNKGWDNSGIAFQKETWEKCYQVLKPGGYLLAFGGSRTFHRIACAIEDAGFEIRDTIMWLYGSGFPKSMDISKSLDKRNGRNYNEDFRNYINTKRKEKNISFKQINEKLGVSTTGGGMASNIFGWKHETNNVLPTKNQYKILKDLLELDDRFDNLIFLEEAKREIIGTKKSGGASAWINGMNNKENEEQKYTGFSEWNITIPSTDLAKQWEGWGTALKPSFEPIIVARKPFKGSLVDNVIEYGVGGINIDECRVGNETTITKRNGNSGANGVYGKDDRKFERENPTGRFPANTILTYDETDFDEVCCGFPSTKSTYNKDNKHETIIHRENEDILKYGYKTRIDSSSYNDSGSASRYFYCAKASKKDRDEGLEEFEEKKTGSMIGNINGNMQLGGASLKGQPKEIQPKKNTHPTVKPTELMQYLVRLVSPNGSTILDCFNGSGSTGKAVMYENKEKNKNYKYIGIEMTEEYLPISKARIEYVCNLKEETDPQTTIFDYME